jgi:hypothetical protein
MFGYGYAQAPPIPPRRTLIPVKPKPVPQKIIIHKHYYKASKPSKPTKEYNLSGKTASIARGTVEGVQGAYQGYKRIKSQKAIYSGGLKEKIKGLFKKKKETVFEE